jgi:hypothetical protein
MLGAYQGNDETGADIAEVKPASVRVPLSKLLLEILGNNQHSDQAEKTGYLTFIPKNPEI